MVVADTSRSLDDLLAAASSRQPWAPEDSKSGARFERVVIDGDRYMLKYQDPRDDWLLRATGDPGLRYVALWERGLLGRLPEVIDPAVVAGRFDGTVGMVLLHDVTAHLLPAGAPFSLPPRPRRRADQPDAQSAAWRWYMWTGRRPNPRRKLPMPDTCTHMDTVADVPPSSEGCEDCLRMGGQWVHLRLCMSCGHVGCCDSSPNRHATAHWHDHPDHPLIRSFEPGEDWWWCYADQLFFELEGAPAAPSHPTAPRS